MAFLLIGATLMNMEGVASVFVDYEGKKGTVEFDASKVAKEKIIATIAELGYKAS